MVRKTKTPKPTVAPVANVVPEVPVVQEATPVAVPEVSGVTTEVTMADAFTSFMANLQALSASFSALKTEFRLLEKKCTRELKAANKASAKRKRKTGNRSPSGFVKPTLISNELAIFLNKPSGTEMARTEVTREINTYVRAHKLQDPSNGRKINPDTKLAKLLKIKKGDELTYFNLQRYMSPHFAKGGVAPANTVAAST
jgi:chromatin remodeling complex protein RSC6